MGGTKVTIPTPIRGDRKIGINGQVKDWVVHDFGFERSLSASWCGLYRCSYFPMRFWRIGGAILCPLDQVGSRRKSPHFSR